MQGRDEVVVFFARLVVCGGALLQHARQTLNVQKIAFRQIEQNLRHGQQIAPVAISQGQHGVTRLGRQRQGPIHQGGGAIQQLIQRRVVQTLQHINLAP
ncbi:hypothetical protein D3C71_1560800 [compost metagenome]